MTSVIGSREVVTLSSAHETLAMVIESEEYAEMQRNVFAVLWGVSASAETDESGTPDA